VPADARSRWRGYLHAVNSNQPHGHCSAAGAHVAVDGADVVQRDAIPAEQAAMHDQHLHKATDADYSPCMEAIHESVSPISHAARLAPHECSQQIELNCTQAEHQVCRQHLI
jgi:hypothetical protein